MHEKLKKRFAETVFKKGSKKDQESALDKAYADMSRRASGHNKTIKNSCIGWINKQFAELLEKSEASDFDFDEWHEKICMQLVDEFNRSKAGFGTVGRAQKVINMGFKYLSCIDNSYDHLLKDCHMTLDGYTLAWYKECVMPWAKHEKKVDVKKIIEWSKIKDYGDYQLIQTNIKDYLNQNPSPKYNVSIKNDKTTSFNCNCIDLPRSRFGAEFIVWEGEIIKAKYTAITKELNYFVKKHRGVEAGRKKDEWLIGDNFTDYLKEYVKML